MFSTTTISRAVMMLMMSLRRHELTASDSVVKDAVQFIRCWKRIYRISVEETTRPNNRESDWVKSHQKTTKFLTPEQFIEPATNLIVDVVLALLQLLFQECFSRRLDGLRRQLGDDLPNSRRIEPRPRQSSCDGQ